MIYATRFSSFTKSLVLMVAAMLGSLSTQAQSGCSDLFFSEYIEGSSFEKYIEIYNPTGSTIDLSDYQLRLYTNGAAMPSQTLTLSGMLASGAVVVVRNGSATGFTGGIVSSAVVNHNGDDAFDLYKISTATAIDIFGRTGNDPGSSWTSGTLSTADQSLRRKYGVTGGVTTNPAGTGPTAFTTLGTEWDMYAINDVSGLGSHSSTCIVPVCSITGITVSSISSCFDNGTPLSASDDYYTANITVSYTNPFLLDTLVLTGSDIIGVTKKAGGSLLGPTSCTFTGVQLKADGGPISLSAYFNLNQACAFNNTNAGTAPSNCSAIPACGALFISEYVEGASNNKCIEIYNPTGATVDLAAGGYQLLIYFNGSSSAGTTINLTGSVASGDTYVVCDDNASADILAAIDQLSTASFFNGDDAVELRNSMGTLDVFGQIGFDPGSAWTGGGLSSENRTLRRFFSVQKGDNDGTNAFDITAEWSGYETDNTNNLDYHATACVPGLPPGIAELNRNCPNGSATYNGGTNTWTLSSNCFNASAHLDDLTGAFQELCGDVSITAEISSMNGLGFAGLMIRESSNLGAKFVWLSQQANQQTRWVTRTTTGGAEQYNQAAPQFGKRWVRLTRAGNVFKGFVSNNGVNWQLLFQSNIPMGNCVIAGLAVFSNVDGAITTANFKNVVIMGTPIPLQADNSGEEAVLGHNSKTAAYPELTLSPNPAGSYIDLAFDNWADEIANVSILDMNGKLVFVNKVERAGNNVVRLDLGAATLSNGVYILTVQNGETVIAKRFVKTDF